MPKPQYPRHLVAKHVVLSEMDRVRINRCRRDYNRLGFAYQLAFVALTGGFPIQSPFQTENEILMFVAYELALDPELIQDYAKRQATVSQHREKIREYLGLVRFEDFDLETFRQFVTEEACRLEEMSALRSRSEEFLRDRDVILPAASTLKRIIGAEREQARKAIFSRILVTLSTGIRAALDDLLVVSPQGASELQILKDSPRSPSPKAMLRLTNKLDQIQRTGVLQVDLTWLNNNFQKALARRVRHSSVYRIRRLEECHRHAGLACFLTQTYRDTIDAVVDMHHKLITDVHHRAKHEIGEEIKKNRHSIREFLRSFNTIANALLDEDLDAEEIRSAVFQHIAPTQLKQQLEAAAEWVTGKKSHSFAGVVKRFNYLRQFSPTLVDHLSVAVEASTQSSIPEAVEILRQMNSTAQRRIPDDAPLDFIPKKILPFVQENDGINRHGYEAAVLTAIRDEIKRGNLWVPGSKRYCRLDDFFIPEEHWNRTREAFFQRAKLPCNPKQIGKYLTERLDLAYERFLATLPDNTYVTIENDGWHFGSTPAEDISAQAEERLKALESWLRSKMRTIRLPDLLIEVDNDLYFTRHLIAGGRRDNRQSKDVVAVIATLLAYAQNIGPKTMARLTRGVSYSDILRITEWSLHEEALRAALADPVNAIASLDTARVWGDGKTSSSDGQRFLFPRKVLRRTYSHRLGDFALEFYTFLADNYAPFYGIPKECTERDAAYVLDGILYHESDLDTGYEHYVDSHGYILLNFLGFAAMGKRFCPRIKGLHRQWIYRINRDRDYGPLTSLVGRRDRTINLQWIEDSWDRIGHFFASLEAGYSTASVALKRIVSYGPKNEFYRGAIEAAKVFKTEFILDLLQDPALRRRQRRGLLKGEQLNSLARNVFYGKRGRADWRDLHRQMCSASCLTVVLACIIYWQIKEIERVLGEHDPRGSGVDVSMLEHVSPIGWDNVILYGQYHLNQNLVRGQPSIEELMEARESSVAQRSRP